MSAIADIILKNPWKSSTFERSTDLNNLFNSGVLTMMGQQANAAVSALDEENMQSTIRMGLSNFPFKEQNLGNTIDTDVAVPIVSDFKEYDVKTFYANQWWRVTNIEQDLMRINEPEKHVREKIGTYWAIQLNKLIGATVSSLTKVSEITVGDGTKNLSLDLVLESRNKKGEMGYGDLGRMYMSSSTLYDILKKIHSGAIPPIITESHGELSISTTNPIGSPPKGVFQTTNAQTVRTPRYLFNGVTPIIIDDSITTKPAKTGNESFGIISLVENGAFGYARKDLTSPLMYQNDPMLANGAGIEAWGTKSMYVVHPLGFGFIGTMPGTFASLSGLTTAELISKKQYKLVDDVKLSKIMNIKVKLG